MSLSLVTLASHRCHASNTSLPNFSPIEQPEKRRCGPRRGPSLVRFVFDQAFRRLEFQHGPLRFRFVSGSFFPQVRVFNNFSASFSGSFLAIHVALPFVFSNFSGSFFKKGILFCFLCPKTRCENSPQGRRLRS